MLEGALIKKIQEVLSPDLLKPEFRANYDQNNPFYGHCYAASEALYHLLGGSKSGYTPYRGKDELGVTHWWLQSKSGQILDPTVEQYLTVNRTPPYHNGKGGGFLTKDPSKRAQEIIKRVQTKMSSQEISLMLKNSRQR